MFIMIILALLLVAFGLMKFFFVKRAATITLIIALVVSTIFTVSLWLNYKASFGEQDGIAVSNKVSYWIITDSIRWSQELFVDYFIYSLVVTILIASIMVISYSANKQTKIA